MKPRKRRDDEPDPKIRELARTAGYIAKRCMEAVLDKHRPADRELGTLLRPLAKLHPRDGRFAARAVFALFRWWGWVHEIADHDLVRALLAAYLLDSAPYHVVTTDWARRYREIPTGALTPPVETAPLADRAAWLRTHLRDPKRKLNPLALVPAWFFKLVELPDRDVEHRLLEIFQRPAPLWIRLRADLPFDGLELDTHARLRMASRVHTPDNLYSLPAFKSGAFEIQDLASQSVGIACDPKPGQRWWDACAGGGGKALQLATMMNPKGTVVATDVKLHKLDETKRRAARARLHNLTTREWDGKTLPAKATSFDGVLVDAPCSGVGTWRRNPDARWRTSPDDVAELSALQKQILDKVVPGLRAGGRLVYAVCTLTRAETVEVVDAFLAAHPDFALDPTPHPLTGAATDGRIWVWPHEHDCDGMFIAVFVRK